MKKQRFSLIFSLVVVLVVLVSARAQTDALSGFWVATEGPNYVKIHFDAFPLLGCHVVWEGEVKWDKAQGRGVVKVFNDQKQNLGAYVATFENGKPMGTVVLIKNPEQSSSLSDCSLGGIAWNAVGSER